MYSLASTLQQEALYIHQLGRSYPNCGTLSKLLNIFSTRLRASKLPMKEEEKLVLTAILTEIALGSPKVYGLVLHLISHLVSKMEKAEDRERTVMAVYNKFRRIPNIGEVQLWMQHITFKMLPDSISYTEPLCKIVAGEKDVKLWDNDWLKEEFKKDFPQGEICNDKVRDKITPIISIDEVALFDTY